MDTPLFSPENLTGIGAFLFVVLFFSVLVLTGKLRTEREFKREREIAETWRKSYEREVAAREIRWNAVGGMMIETSKTVGHALESIQDEAKKARVDGPQEE